MQSPCVWTELIYWLAGKSQVPNVFGSKYAYMYDIFYRKQTMLAIVAFAYALNKLGLLRYA